MRAFVYEQFLWSGFYTAFNDPYNRARETKIRTTNADKRDKKQVLLKQNQIKSWNVTGWKQVPAVNETPLEELTKAASIRRKLSTDMLTSERASEDS